MCRTTTEATLEGVIGIALAVSSRPPSSPRAAASENASLRRTVASELSASGGDAEDTPAVGAGMTGPQQE
eukprot:7401435-Alexandrium_andersonii.AAC.1